MHAAKHRSILWFLAAFLGLAMCCTAFGAVLDTVWTGGATGNWFDLAWDNGIPNNGGGDFYNVFLDNNELQDTTLSLLAQRPPSTASRLTLATR